MEQWNKARILRGDILTKYEKMERTWGKIERGLKTKDAAEYFLSKHVVFAFPLQNVYI